MPFLTSLPEHSNAMHVWPLHERGFEAWGPLIKAVMRHEKDEEFTHRDKELIGAYASAMNGCTHCYSAHSASAVALGIGAELFDDVEVDPWEAPVEDNWKPLLAYIRKVCREPSTLSQDDADKVFAAGWSEQALSDAIQVAGAFSYMNTMMIGHGADQQDLRSLGVINAVLRDNEDYGYNDKHRNMMQLYTKAVEQFGAEAAQESFRASLGLIAGGNTNMNKRNNLKVVGAMLPLLTWFSVAKIKIKGLFGAQPSEQ